MSRLPLALLLIIALTGCGGTTQQPAPTTSADPVATPTVTASACPSRDGEATGRIHGQSFTVEASKIEQGVFELRQGEDFFAEREIDVFLFLDEGEIPAGRTFEITNDSGYGSPHIHMGFKTDGKDVPTTEMFMDKYEMRLSFGQENDGMLPGTIHLCLPDEHASFVSGTFNAKIEGFRLVNGEPDLQQDAHQNFTWLARRHLVETLGTDAIEIVGTNGSNYVNPNPQVAHQTGSVEVTYKAGDGGEESRRFLFVKEPERWRLHDVLTMDQFSEAHPYKTPSDEDRPRQVVGYLVARELERRIGQDHPGRAVFPANGYSIVQSYRISDEYAEVTARYKLDADDTEPIEIVLVLRNDVDGWIFER